MAAIAGANRPDARPLSVACAIRFNAAMSSFSDGLSTVVPFKATPRERAFGRAAVYQLRRGVSSVRADYLPGARWGAKRSSEPSILSTSTPHLAAHFIASSSLIFHGGMRLAASDLTYSLVTRHDQRTVRALLVTWDLGDHRKPGRHLALWVA